MLSSPREGDSTRSAAASGPLSPFMRSLIVIAADFIAGVVRTSLIRDSEQSRGERHAANGFRRNAKAAQFVGPRELIRHVRDRNRRDAGAQRGVRRARSCVMDHGGALGENEHDAAPASRR